MTQTKAENFLLNAEGRVCVKYYRRTDGTVLTQDCPVGWQVVKQKVSRLATVSLAVIFGFLGGIVSLESLKSLRSFTNYDKVPEPFFESNNESSFGIYGMLENLPKLKIEIFQNRNKF